MASTSAPFIHFKTSQSKNIISSVFVNLFYEFNNELLDFVFSQQSNLKCALYADIHTAAEKINFGGQQSEPLPAPLTYIQQSSGYAANTLVEPAVPNGYEYVFGPIDGANNAPGVSFHAIIISPIHLFIQQQSILVYGFRFLGQIRRQCLCRAMQRSRTRPQRRRMPIFQHLARFSRRNPHYLHM